MRIEVAVLNHTSHLSDDTIAAITEALQSQVSHDFQPWWGMNAEIKAIPKGQPAPPGSWWLVFLDNATQAGELGVHDLTPSLHPVGKVFVGADLQYGASPSVTASHELLEMLGDPYINLTALDAEANRLYAYETADACEADNFGYKINGILVSDFVTPHFFDPLSRSRDVRLDFAGHIPMREPFSLLPGGYLSYLDLNEQPVSWHQTTADVAPESDLIVREPGFPEGSRRERRLRARAGSLLVSEGSLEAPVE